MEIELVRNQNRNYALVRLTENQLHTHECRMLSYHQIPCLLPVRIRYVDELLQAEYDFSGMQPLSGVFLHNRLTEDQIIWLIRSLREAQEVLLEYMLSPDGLLLEPEYIFVEPLSMAVRFCYQPGAREAVEQNVRDILQYILDHVDYTDQRAVTLAYALYHLEDGTGDILHTLGRYIEKTRLCAGEAPAADRIPEEDTVCEGGKLCMQSPQQGFFYRLFHRKGKRMLLLEHAALSEGQAEEVEEIRPPVKDPAGKRFIL